MDPDFGNPTIQTPVIQIPTIQIATRNIYLCLKLIYQIKEYTICTIILF